MGISSVQRKLQEQERTKQEVRSRTVISLDIFLTQVTAMTIIRWQFFSFKGRLASQILVPKCSEQVFVFFQVWVPKHAYFSSKSVFL